MCSECENKSSRRCCDREFSGCCQKYINETCFTVVVKNSSPFWVRYLRTCPFFNPTIDVVSLRLRGWCMLGVILLSAFTRLGHECQYLFSPCDGMHVRTNYRPWFVLSPQRALKGMESESMLSPIPCTGGSQEGRTHDAASRRTASPTHYTLSYSGPEAASVSVQMAGSTGAVRTAKCESLTSTGYWH